MKISGSLTEERKYLLSVMADVNRKSSTEKSLHRMDNGGFSQDMFRKRLPYSTFTPSTPFITMTAFIKMAFCDEDQDYKMIRAHI